jgi:truncated hemoglobin YjbI
LKPEWWGSPLFQEEKYQEKPVKREEEKEEIITRRIHLVNLF